MRPQTHHTLRYTIAHLFRARPCNRSYVTEEAVRLPQAELRAIRANVTRGLHRSVAFARDALFSRGNPLLSLPRNIVRPPYLTQEI